MVIAPTGRGKGVGFVIPNLLTFKGSTVVLDVKGENFEKTARRRQEMGDDVIRFSPTDFAANSHRYNPLKRISEIENSAQQMFELSKLATLFLVADNPHNEGLLRGGMNAFVAGAILAFERGRPTLGEVYRIINGGDGDYASTFRSYAQETQNPQAAVLWSSLAKVVDKTLSGYISMVNTGGLDPWKNSHIDAMTAVSDFSFEDLRRNPQSIYLTIRDQDIGRERRPDPAVLLGSDRDLTTSRARPPGALASDVDLG